MDPPQDLWAVFRLDQADLEIVPCSDLNVSGSEIARDGGEFTELIGLDRATWNTQTAHVSVLHRIEPKESIPFEAEHIVGFGLGVPAGFEDKFLGGIEWIEIVLDALLFGELVPVGPGRYSRNRGATEIGKRDALGGGAGEEAFEVALLLR